MKKKILIIEDDVEINDMLRILLRQNGYHTISAYSGTEGLLVHSKEVNLILLDLMLPGRSGEDIIRELKAKHNVPVIVTSAIHDVGKKVELFAYSSLLLEHYRYRLLKQLVLRSCPLFQQHLRWKEFYPPPRNLMQLIHRSIHLVFCLVLLIDLIHF